MIELGHMNPVDSFRGEYRFLSNFWPVEVCFEGTMYPSVEQAYKAAKTLNKEARDMISKLTPNKKELVEQLLDILNTYGVRKDWNDELRLSVMEFLLRQKFSTENRELRDMLFKTKGKELIEGNTWGDTFFGVCESVGENHLGRLLMKIRDKIF